MNLSRVSERYGLRLKTGLKSAHCYNQNALNLVMYRRTDIMSIKAKTVQTKSILSFTLIAKRTVLIT